MEEEITPSPEYIKAFNNGYLLAKHESKLLNALLQSTTAKENDYIKGMLDGMKQAEKEKIQLERQQREQQQHKRQRRL